MRRYKNSQPKVAILLGTFNGEKYIADQLNSLATQTHENWFVVISDDGSTDGTIEILKKYQLSWGVDKIEVRRGPQKGFTQNFLSMACDLKINADYYAFCDQDDVWLPEKLMVAICHIEEEARQLEPYLYCGRTTYAREDLVPYGKSPLFVRPCTFRNALIQSIAGGNTMVFNRAAKELVEKVGIVPAVSHDWWLYQLISGVGGSVYYDKTSYILYRQHRDAVIGANNTIKDRMQRIGMTLRGQYRLWNDRNIEALTKGRDLLNQDAIEVLTKFTILRNLAFVPRLRNLIICRLYRQTLFGTIGLLFAASLKKI